MQQHPIPQNVTQYQFRLVGDMTLKQFLELALGLVLAYLCYASNLIFIIKWPLALMSLLLGAGLAFFPIEDRPLDQWITNFIKAIYRPTRFIWKKTNKVPSIFTFEAHPIAPTRTITKTIKAPTISNRVAPAEDLTPEESTRVSSLDSLFTALPPSPIPPPSPQKEEVIIVDKPTVSVRKLHSINDTALPPSKPSLAVPKAQPTPVDASTATPTASPKSEAIPQTLIFSAANKASSSPPTAPKTNLVKAPLKSIQLPVAPRLPNLVVGVTTSLDGKLIEGAIVQILDSSGLPARAIKTNALGQFATSTPLSSGTYTIEVEADGHSFAPQQLIIKGEVIPPFEIRATS